MSSELRGKRNKQRMDDIIKEMERESFIHRENEIALFNDLAFTQMANIKVFHMYGPGGVGKTFLLKEFLQMAIKKGNFCLSMDSEDFIHTPEGFSNHVISLLNEQKVLKEAYKDKKQKLYQYCLETLEEIATDRQIVIMIDSYYRMSGLDRWFREVFVRHMHPNIFIVLADRKSLQGEWVQSRAWRKVTKQIEIPNFNFKQTYAFVTKAGIQSDQTIQSLWHFTNGHPLTLSLATLTNEELDLQNTGNLTDEIPHILMKLTKVWLREVIDESLLYLVEIAALFNTFNQSSLSTILKKEISILTFNELISFSFIKRMKDGWVMHDLIKDAVRVDLEYRNPEYYKLLKDRLISYYYKKTIATRSVMEISQFFYHIGDEAIQSAFFQDELDTSLYLEPVEEYNFEEIKDFFVNRKKQVSETNVQFFDRITNKSVQFLASKEHNLKETELIDETYIQKMGFNSVQMLKNKEGKTLGISIVVPIHQGTLKQLAEEPVSRTYFSKLDQKEWDEYNVPESQSKGMFIRMLDYTEDATTSARSFLLYNLFTYLLSGGKIITSTPLPFFQDLLGRFGFSEVPFATHYDYGENVLSPTYLLDVSGPNFAAYLKKFITNISKTNQMKAIMEAFDLTKREKDVVMLILENKTNADIAKQLYVAEVTVKKHVTNILRKVNVTNRTELIREIMELI